VAEPSITEGRAGTDPRHQPEESRHVGDCHLRPRFDAAPGLKQSTEQQLGRLRADVLGQNSDLATERTFDTVEELRQARVSDPPRPSGRASFCPWHGKGERRAQPFAGRPEPNSPRGSRAQRACCNMAIGSLIYAFTPAECANYLQPQAA
jgi:hypothetical protein